MLKYFLIYFAKYSHPVLSIIALILLGHKIKKLQLLNDIKTHFYEAKEDFYLNTNELKKVILLISVIILYIVFNKPLGLGFEDKIAISSILVISGTFMLWNKFSLFLHRISYKPQHLCFHASNIWFFQMIIALPLGLVFWALSTKGDFQNLRHLEKIQFVDYIKTILGMIPSLFLEELFVLFLFILFLNLLNKTSHNFLKNTIIASIGSSFVFGVLHLFAWNLKSGLLIFALHIITSIYFVYIKDIIPFFLFHVFNNCIALATLTTTTVLIKDVLICVVIVPYFLLFFKQKNIFNMILCKKGNSSQRPTV